MSVGGRLIEIQPMTVRTDFDAQREVVRLWCVDRAGTEACVYVEPAEAMPKLGEEVWWQGGKVMFDGDKRYLVKVGGSFSPPAAGTR
jgi:hypothetical protein